MGAALASHRLIARALLHLLVKATTRRHICNARRPAFILRLQGEIRCNDVKVVAR